MGRCGGKYCQPSVANLMAETTGMMLDDIMPATPRSPLRPVPLGLLTADFKYSDLPSLKSAPL